MTILINDRLFAQSLASSPSHSLTHSSRVVYVAFTRRYQKQLMILDDYYAIWINNLNFSLSFFFFLSTPNPPWFWNRCCNVVTLCQKGHDHKSIHSLISRPIHENPGRKIKLLPRRERERKSVESFTFRMAPCIQKSSFMNDVLYVALLFFVCASSLLVEIGMLKTIWSTFQTFVFHLFSSLISSFVVVVVFVKFFFFLFLLFQKILSPCLCHEAAAFPEQRKRACEVFLFNVNFVCIWHHQHSENRGRVDLWWIFSFRQNSRSLFKPKNNE